MSSLLKTSQEICKLYKIKPNSQLGQSFLINVKVYEKIIKAADIKDKEVLEVGPGLGFLTASLIKEAKKVVAVELDPIITTYLRTALLTSNINNLEIVEQNILNFNPRNYFENNYHIVANLPYNISSIFLRTYLSHIYQPSSLTLMLQKEVAQRIMAKEPNNNLLALSVKYFAKAQIIDYVPADSFWPQPKVDSAIIKIVCQNQENDKKLFQVMRAGFSSKRKMLKNNLKSVLKIDIKESENILNKLKLNPLVRAENLSLDNWQSLKKELQKNNLLKD
jgi:16S rRNA (adenine1518-N6/adenine1519-N6)-dimethyltransferase